MALREKLSFVPCAVLDTLFWRLNMRFRGASTYHYAEDSKTSVQSNGDDRQFARAIPSRQGQIFRLQVDAVPNMANAEHGVRNAAISS